MSSSLWFFCNHRLPLALAARRRGFDVRVAAPRDRYDAVLRAAGIELLELPLERGLRGFGDLGGILRLARILLRYRPDVLHLIAAKPVAYGGILARLLRVPAVVSAISGLGYAFTSRGRHSWLRALMLLLYKVALRHPRQAVIFQNRDDRDLLVQLGVCPAESAVLIEGSGVDSSRYGVDRRDGEFRVVLGARLLADKGVREFVSAARRVRERHPEVRFVIAGDVDPANPSAIAQAEVEGWVAEGLVTWLGWRDDMDVVLRTARIACLPSYREGMPRFLIEAAASGVPIVTTDVPGCRNIVRDQFNGLLVPARDADALAAAILRLCEDPDLCARLGRNGRRLVRARFDVRIIAAQTIALYERLLPTVPALALVPSRPAVESPSAPLRPALGREAA